MENITPIAVTPVAMVVPSMESTDDPPVPPTVASALPNPCRDIVLYQSEAGGSVPFPSSESTLSPPSPPVSQKPRTFQGKAPPISKKVRPSLSSPSPPVSKRVTRSSSSHQSPSKPIGPPRPPSKVSIPTPTSERVQPKRKSSADTTYHPPEKKSKKKPTPVASTESSPKRSSRGSKKSKLPKVPISTGRPPATRQCFVDASKASVYQRWFGSRELWFEQVVILDDFPELHEFLKLRKWVNTVTNLSAPHPILVREFYANLDRTVIAEGHPGCVSAFVRGHRVPFGPSTIASLLQVESIRNPTYGKHFSPDQSLMGRVLTGRDDYIWDKQEILVTHLTPFYRVLHRVALYNWFPNSHLSAVTLEIGKFLYAVGTNVSIDLPSLIFDRVLEASESTGTRNKLPFPSLVQRVLMDAHPPLTTHDYQVQNPILSKSFLSVVNRKPSSTTPSATTVSKGKSPLFKGLSDSSWQSTLLHHFPGDSLPDISLPEFHRDSFGASSDTSGNNAHMQGEPSALDPVTSSVQLDLDPLADTATPFVSTGPPSCGSPAQRQKLQIIFNEGGDICHLFCLCSGFVIFLKTFISGLLIFSGL
ncbi:uncharacterized protein LOC133039265 [Cannabis sativa]|uniref:uncharacterized protein LOC133039265 n=1 Tax=Cannabis sativa TaxID=3483 RepID=UPI0029C9ED2A|nr:uncharacterized protein LOC133039265 [Cannabis sativa]